MIFPLIWFVNELSDFRFIKMLSRFMIENFPYNMNFAADTALPDHAAGARALVACTLFTLKDSPRI
jgi:hypothetical protein